MQNKLRLIFVGSTLFVGIPFLALGQESEQPVITTERPTVGYSPDLIPAKSLQIENGASVTFQRQTYVADFPESLIRYGVTRQVEIRFLASDAVFQPSSQKDLPFFQRADTSVSTKWLLSGPNKLAPKSAVLYLDLPTGGRSWTSGSYDPGLTLVWTQSFKTYFLNEVPQVTLTTSGGARRALWGPSIAGGRSFTKSLAGFVEYAPTISPDRTLQYVVDGGIAITIGLFRQFDFRTGYLKDSAGVHTLFTIGYSVRCDHSRRVLE